MKIREENFFCYLSLVVISLVLELKLVNLLSICLREREKKKHYKKCSLQHGDKVTIGAWAFTKMKNVVINKIKVCMNQKFLDSKIMKTLMHDKLQPFVTCFFWNSFHQFRQSELHFFQFLQNNHCPFCFFLFFHFCGRSHISAQSIQPFWLFR